MMDWPRGSMEIFNCPVSPVRDTHTNADATPPHTTPTPTPTQRRLLTTPTPVQITLQARGYKIRPAKGGPVLEWADLGFYRHLSQWC
ncbi:MAG: hypothetical protein Udaeo2_29470 [Candidatus Udaeobacter sp.]|nr:MAG: hypothetical protein Udaeo2_29470 [Candidatus Udaeobacter sp.]